MASEEPGTGTSAFFDPGPISRTDSLAILHLKRTDLVPVVLQSSGENAAGYTEGAVKNTRFGSFPHSTLTGVPWGSQVRASKVDTGSRGRNGGSKRKREGPEDAPQDDDEGSGMKILAAGTGFTHLLPPTPESWTLSLPHRTQVVYTPDYSFILQKMRVRPGQSIIEAGAGSGSFTHAAARAVFNGYSSRSTSGEAPRKKQRLSKVYSFEYHEPRAEGLRTEVKEHGLDDVVRVTHRDVYQDGFCLNDSNIRSPCANAVFLDLPAPWLALKHLTRRRVSPRTAQKVNDEMAVDANEAESLELQADGDPAQVEGHPSDFISPLDPESPIWLCTFSPCIEQVQSTASALRRLGWTEIETFTIQHRRIDVRRERVGLHEEGLRGVNASAATVDEAVGRLREVEDRWHDWHEHLKVRQEQKKVPPTGGQAGKKSGPKGVVAAVEAGAEADNFPGESRQDRLARIKEASETRKIFKEGQLVHRTEQEIKSHTSYLTFAVLPREWTAEDEERALERWGTGPLAQAAEKPKNAKGVAKDRRMGKKKAQKLEKEARRGEQPAQST